QYKVNRGRKDHWAMYDCPQKIDVVYEPEDGVDPKKGAKPRPKQVMQTVLSRGSPRILSRGDVEGRSRQRIEIDVPSDSRSAMTWEPKPQSLTARVTTLDDLKRAGFINDFNLNGSGSSIPATAPQEPWL